MTGPFRSNAKRSPWYWALPSVIVRYRREAWSSEIDEYARATFDHKLEAARQPYPPLGSLQAAACVRV